MPSVNIILRETINSLQDPFFRNRPIRRLGEEDHGRANSSKKHAECGLFQCSSYSSDSQRTRNVVQRCANLQGNPIKPNAKMAEAVAEGEGTGDGVQHQTRVRVRDVLARSAQLALQARVLIAGIHGQGPSAFATVNKDAASFDPQTAADREAELVLVQGLRASFPGIRIVGEEHEAGLSAAEAEDADDADDEGDAVQNDKGEIASPLSAASDVDFTSLLAAQNDSLSDEDTEVDLGRVLVFVDPLDGTRSFISGALKYVTTLVGIAVDGTPVGGIICSVFGGSMLLGGSCVGGVFLHEDATPNALKPIPTECANPRKVVVSKSRSKGLVLEHLEQLASLGLVDNAWVHASGAGFKFAMVVRGEVGVYSFPRAGTCRWDTCAGTALILAQGGAVLNRLGEPIIYEGGKLKNDEGFVATRDPALSTKICQHLAAHGVAAATTPCP